MTDIKAWLSGLGLGKYEEIFVENEIDAEVLSDLTDGDLKELGIPLGPRKKLLRAISDLADGGRTDVISGRTPLAPTPPAPVSETASEAERRQLTVMFCDLVGSTSLSTQMDPEDLREVIRAFQTASEAVIERYGGLVARYMGDGILAYFGYPHAHEDDVERAVHAGLKLIEAIATLDLPNVPGLQNRVGIATGLVVVGELIGRGEAQEREVLGETPNLAARLQSLATPNSVVISDVTHQLVGELFEYEDLGVHELKGFAAPTRAWCVVNESLAESRFEALHPDELSPLIGRAQEVAVLMRHWGRARAGSGRLIEITGEPGVGKSRLIQALRENLSGESYTQLQLQCSPYHTDSPLYPIGTQIERAAGFKRDDSAQVKLAKLEAVLTPASQKVPNATALLAALLSVPTAGRYPPLHDTAQRQREKTLDALMAQLEGLAAVQPVLLVLEDAHWIDPTTVELIAMLVERLAGLPALVIMTIRAEFESPWTGHEYCTRIALNRLQPDEAASIAARITGGKLLPRELLELIVDKTDGVPLYVEELTKTIIESGMLKETEDRYSLPGPLPELQVPATLQDSLIARLDRLGSAKQLAQLGATIGREFGYRLLAAVTTSSPNTLERRLKRLVDSELLIQRGSPPDATYTFRHALVQDASYSTLLRKNRQAYHSQIAAALQEHFPETGETHPEVMARHFTEGGLHEQGIDWWYKAGQHAANRSANQEAIAQFKRGLALLEKLDDDPKRDLRELDLQIGLGQAFIAAKGFAAAQVMEAYSRARELCSRPGVDAHQVVRTMVGLWNFHLVRGDLKTALEVAKQRFELAQRAGEIQSLPGAHQNLGATFYNMGAFGSARSHLSEGIALYDRQPSEHLGSFNIRMGSLCYQAWASWMLGYPDQALEQSEELVHMAEQSAHPFGITFALFVAACLHQFRRETSEVESCIDRMVAISQEHGFEYRVAQGKIFQGWALSEQGQFDAGIAQLRDGLAEWWATGAEVMGPYFHALLAEAYGHSGHPIRAFDALAVAMPMANRHLERYYEAELYRLNGELLLQMAESPVVEDTRITLVPENVALRESIPDESFLMKEPQACFLRALEVARSQGAKSLELRAAIAVARFLRETGREAEAFDQMTRSYSWFKEGFQTTDLLEAKSLLDELG